MQPTLFVTDGASTSITCNYGISDATYTFRSLTWREYIQEQDSYSTFSAFDKGDISPRFVRDDAASMYRVTMDSTMNRSILTIISVRFRSNNDVIYQCFVQYRKTTSATYGIFNVGDTQLLENGK